MNSSIRIIVRVAAPLFFAGALLSQTETDPGHWWSPAADGNRENGKISELAGRKRVYVLTSFTDSRTISEPAATHSSEVQRIVLEAVLSQKDLQVVSLPTQADFAIRVRAVASTDTGERPPNFSVSLDPSTVIAIEVLVLIPGARRSDGAVRPRVVWESSVENAQVEAHSAARSTVDAFLWQWSKLNQKPAAKTK